MEESPKYAAQASAYYLPSDKKLKGLGFEIVSSGPNVVVAEMALAPRCGRGTAMIEIDQRLYGGGIRCIHYTMTRNYVFRGRLRSEAEFDLLLWQIGWTDAEPADELTRLRRENELLRDAFLRLHFASGSGPPETEDYRRQRAEQALLNLLNQNDQ